MDKRWFLPAFEVLTVLREDRQVRSPSVTRHHVVHLRAKPSMALPPWAQQEVGAGEEVGEGRLCDEGSFDLGLEGC